LKKSTFILCLIIASLLITLSIVLPARSASGPGRSIYDGSWTITHTGCSGKTTIYEDCRVLDINDVYVTFTSAGRSREIKLPLVTGCSETVMERRH
jgi:hypothetical protein